MRYHENQSFEPADENEHRRGNSGYPVTDRCRNCGHPYMDHYNGRCPKDDTDTE